MKKTLRIIRNKYLLATLLFAVWVSFFDRNDLISQYRYRQKLARLEKDKDYFVNEISKTRNELEQLKTDPKNLERFAREKYLMKKDNEDIFLIVTNNSSPKAED